MVAVPRACHLYPQNKSQPLLPILPALWSPLLCAIFKHLSSPEVCLSGGGETLIPTIKPLQPEDLSDSPASGLVMAESETGPCNEALEAKQNGPACKHHDRKDDFN